jgi:hypothetical protein
VYTKLQYTIPFCLTKCQRSAPYIMDRANSIVFTSKRLPLQPVSWKKESSNSLRIILETRPMLHANRSIICFRKFHFLTFLYFLKTCVRICVFILGRSFVIAISLRVFQVFYKESLVIYFKYFWHTLITLAFTANRKWWNLLYTVTKYNSS